MKTCPYCSALIDDADAVCRVCGTPQSGAEPEFSQPSPADAPAPAADTPPAAPSVKYCPRCGTPNEYTARVCSVCSAAFPGFTAASPALSKKSFPLAAVLLLAYGLTSLISGIIAAVRHYGWQSISGDILAFLCFTAAGVLLLVNTKKIFAFISAALIAFPFVTTNGINSGTMAFNYIRYSAPLRAYLSYMFYSFFAGFMLAAYVLIVLTAVFTVLKPGSGGGFAAFLRRFWFLPAAASGVYLLYASVNNEINRSGFFYSLVNFIRYASYSGYGVTGYLISAAIALFNFLAGLLLVAVFLFFALYLKKLDAERT